MTALELLAPARNADIGIAAIDCGADAVYIAGPAFGARQAAGNSLGEVARLCSHARKFGARIFLTLNTILHDDEIEEARAIMIGAQEARVDGFIIQDLATLHLAAESGIKVPLHASTQCAIRTPEDAIFYEKLGCSRLVLERQLSIEQIKAIRRAVSCELECFVYGALCVCYSGQCYLSEAFTGRSANRGECIQACRSRYDLLGADGKPLLKDKAVLSLKDLNLLDRLGDLADAGICSFKIEGRLKNISYVKNVVREASLALDEIVTAHPSEYRRSSFGKVENSFTPQPSKTFNRGYTHLYIDGKKGLWAAMDIPKNIGEYAGSIESVRQHGRNMSEITLKPAVPQLILSNGDGFSFFSGSEVTGFRGDICKGNRILTKTVAGLQKNVKIYRNLSVDFEKILCNAKNRRLIPVYVSAVFAETENTPDPIPHIAEKKSDKENFNPYIPKSYYINIKAIREDGETVTLTRHLDNLTQLPRNLTEELLKRQIEKTSVNHRFHLVESSICNGFPSLSAAFINELRRELGVNFDALACKKIPLENRAIPQRVDAKVPSSLKTGNGALSYKANVANALARDIWKAAGADGPEPDGEEVEYMRSRYCVRRELGLCPGKKTGAPDLLLLNNGRTLTLRFDCRSCEMTVINSRRSQK